MNGAQTLVKTLISQGIDVCFANPGTSEMHFVAALDTVKGMRCVLGLHETVVTGAADGYARMAGKPAATLLHTGPGLANGLSNLHNARKAWSPVVNIVGEHALQHIEHDAPLTSDIQGIAKPVSHWVDTPQCADELASAGVQAVKQARLHPGHVATLILPANTAWESVGEECNDAAEPVDTTAIVDEGRVAGVAEALGTDMGEICFVLGGDCLQAEALELADRLAQKLGATVLAETFKSRFQRGEGRVNVREVPYSVDQAIKLLKPFTHVVTVCAKAPVGFFAYPDKPSRLYNPAAQVHELASVYEDGIGALQALVQALGATSFQPRLQQRATVEEPANGKLDAHAVGALLANRLPHDAIVVDEAITSGIGPTKSLGHAAAHDWLEVCGGSIGGGMPLATGAAIACPQRRVVNLQADGSGMYSVQALWTQAREKLNITTIIFANHSYAILKHELKQVQASSSKVALDMMELDRPRIDWVGLSKSMGVEAVRANTVDEFRTALEKALSYEGAFFV